MSKERRNIMKKRLTVMLFAVLMVMMFALPIHAAVKITPSTTYINVLKGKTVSIKINTSKKVKWQIHDTSVAKIISKSRYAVKVKGLQKGTTPITVTVNGLPYTRHITVWNAGELLTKTYRKIGSGVAYITIGNTDSRGGKIPTAGFGDYFIKIDCFNFKKTERLYIYIDRRVYTSAMVGGKTEFHTSIGGNSDNMSSGTHTVEFIQYKDGNPNKSPIFYRKVKYKAIG